MSGPFKMKGSPMQRNFGIGSPAKGKLDDLLKGVFSKGREIATDVVKNVNQLSSKVNTATQKVGSDAVDAVSSVVSGADKIGKGVQGEVTKVSKGVQGVLSNIFGKDAIAKRKAKNAARKAAKQK
jgi:hypothetical protein